MHHPERAEFDALSPGGLAALAETLCLDLPDGWSIGRIASGEEGKPAQLLLGVAGAQFSYIPGDEYRLGFDASRWRPSAAEQASFADSAEEWGLDQTIEEWVARQTQPPRIVRLGPFLCETVAGAFGFERLDPQSEEARSILARTSPSTRLYVDGSIAYRIDRTTEPRIARKRPVPHAALTAAYAAKGFRLPSAEEWEAACAGGAGTLYPWGDHAPCDRYPIDPPVPADDPDRDVGFPPGWDAHRRPNQRGIQGPHDPYKGERVAKPDRLIGGDGGAMICGGAGFFLGWLPLAPSWFDPEICQGPDITHWAETEALSRRVLPLA